MRVLLVEDDASVADGIIDGLGSAQFTTSHVTTGAACLAAMNTFRPDLVLLDLGLPDMDGIDVCRAIRARHDTPIIVVSARDGEIDRVIALEIGADDYVVKPFGMRELVARIRAVHRRFGASAEALETEQEPTERRFGDLVIDTRAQRVTLDNSLVYLTPKEFALLVYLSDDPGAVFRRADILHDVWDTNWYGTTKTLDAHIAAIRKKLGNPGWIESVRGVGFRFEQPAPIVPSQSAPSQSAPSQ
ncbi:response regulator transcription factor [Cryobacterium frigoriphilum]|uniref:Response regulator transcription factor n=1 Tax=Cryobacterium frigoriphilum TaxID=1259150 RepID=A0A4R8ZVD5_9MICO|nr:response regulator transcription factor [Cryobacterium frigoriphilum]TFD47001.1 response regulator transcription factor [Cryobacterium frigoriphilum]